MTTTSRPRWWLWDPIRRRAVAAPSELSALDSYAAGRRPGQERATCPNGRVVSLMWSPHDNFATPWGDDSNALPLLWRVQVLEYLPAGHAREVSTEAFATLEEAEVCYRQRRRELEAAAAVARQGEGDAA